MKEPIEGAVCPCCQGQIYRTDRFIMCENQGRDPGDCHFFLTGKTASGKEIPDKDILKLCAGETVGPYTLLSKNKEKFKTWFKCDESTGEVKFIFDPDEHETEYKCPICGEKLTYKNGKYGHYLTCKNNDFHMSAEYCQHKFSDSEIRKLLSGETVYADDFVSRKGNNFAANAVLDTSSGKITLQFDD